MKLGGGCGVIMGRRAIWKDGGIYGQCGGLGKVGALH